MSVGARRIGFIASALLHAGVAGMFLLPGSAPVGSAPTERRVALSLDMFESPGVAVAPTAVTPQSTVPPQPVVQAPPPGLADTIPEPLPVVPELRPSKDNSEPAVAARDVETKPPRQAARRPAREPVVKPRPARRMAAAPATRTRPERPELQAAPIASAATPAESSRQAETTVREVPAAQVNRLKQDYLADLVNAIHRNKYYPRKARRRSEQGTVVVGFTIEQDGSLSEIGVRSSSGIRRLDDAALKTLRKLTPFRPIPEALNRDRWPITVPIEFRLR